MIRPTRIFIAMFVCLVAWLGSAQPAAAVVPPLTAITIAPGDAYSGWGYLRAPASPLQIWRYSTAGWQPATLAAGSPVWVAPWGGGWNWIWVSGAWHATETSHLAVWSCNSVGADAHIAVGSSGATLRPRNSVDAAATTTLAAGTQLSLNCANGFRDANTTRTTVHALVHTSAGTSGYVEVARLIAGSSAPTSGAYPPDVSAFRYIPTPSMARPAYLAPYTDPTFGTRVIRVSDQAAMSSAKRELRNAYSKTQSWNADQSLIMLGFTYPAPLIDGKTFRFIRMIHQPSEATWSSTNPNYMYGAFGGTNQFVRMDMRTDSYTVLRAFTGYNTISIGDGEGYLSDDDKYVALGATTSAGGFELVVYDVFNNVIVSQKDIGGHPNNWTISPSGKYVLVNWEGDGAGRGVEVYGRDLVYQRRLNTRGAHGDIARDATGMYEMWVQSGADLPAYRLDTGTVTRLLPGGGTVFGYSHVSARNNLRPGWVYVSHYDIVPGGAPGFDQVAAVKTDGSGTVEVFAHAHHLDQIYGDSPFAQPNRTGTQVLFGSEWAGSAGPAYAYVAGVTLG